MAASFKAILPDTLSTTIRDQMGQSRSTPVLVKASTKLNGIPQNFFHLTLKLLAKLIGGMSSCMMIDTRSCSSASHAFQACFLPITMPHGFRHILTVRSVLHFHHKHFNGLTKPKSLCMPAPSPRKTSMRG